MKIVKQGFRVEDISDGITTVIVEHDHAFGTASFSILSRNVVSGAGEQTERMPLSDLDALIEALQEVKRVTAAESADRLASEPPARVRDNQGDIWTRDTDGLYALRSGGVRWELNSVNEAYGPVTPLS